MKTAILISAIFVSAMFFKTNAFSQEHHGQLIPGGSLYFRAEPVNNFVKQSENNDVYYYIHLQGVKKEDAVVKKRIPMNICLVIDRSGSMYGEKLENVKKAVIYVINQLSYDDILSIVFYDTEVNVLFGPQRIEDREKLIGQVEKISSGNSTNLEGGIRKGFDLVNKGKEISDREMVSRVILLSDGLANVGVSDPNALAAITSGVFERDHISVSTFGVGLDYNEDLMSKIALQAGGKYYFINSSETMPDIFKEELYGISKVVAQNTKIVLHFPDGVIYHDKTFAYKGILGDSTLSISFNDIFSEEQKAILVRFRTNKVTKQSFTIKATITCTNTNLEPASDISFTCESVISPAKNDEQYKGGFNKSASEGYALQVTGEIYESAVQAANNNNYTASHEKIKEAKELLENHFAYIGENSYLRSLYNDLTDYEKIIDDMKNMSREKRSFTVKSYKATHFRAISCPSF